jgi:hypothetical protein
MKKDGELKDGAEPLWLKTVSDQVGSLRFGVVQIVVHENRVVQIERTERTRFENPESSKHSPLDHQRQR